MKWRGVKPREIPLDFSLLSHRHNSTTRATPSKRVRHQTLQKRYKHMHVRRSHDLAPTPLLTFEHPIVAPVHHRALPLHSVPRRSTIPSHSPPTSPSPPTKPKPRLASEGGVGGQERGKGRDGSED
ncbi:hypothetical protein DM02DRAFT_354583 [Periconia macrospinosa]|uniref:Uncharacterized protein n=1 Tax=Periconia macrospinosa TaxID=97972 RepID=A0A2V1E972_9PLEO|nr:hypothetical protein DM02DRAFT_354583 [Periconia macrospinosa]